MTNVFKLKFLFASYSLMLVAGCSSLPTQDVHSSNNQKKVAVKTPTGSDVQDNPMNSNQKSNDSSSQKTPYQQPNIEAKKETFLFSANEIRDLSSAFRAGSCDLSNLKQQSQKYDLSDTWVNLYDRTPKPLSELNQQQKCFLAQSNELYAYTDDFYDESEQSLNETWYRGNIPNTAKVATMRYMTPKAIIPYCDPRLGRPVLIDYEKDEDGKIVRTIIINEDFDSSCVS